MFSSIKNIHWIVTIIFTLLFSGLYSQEFNKEQQYQQAMANAKTAFSAKKYSEAVLFYHEAMTIKPDAKLPRYKIEDIRTIYIEKELKKRDIKTVKKENKKNNDEVKDPIIAQAEAEADRQMETDAKQAKTEMQQLKIETRAIAIDEDEEVSTENIQVANLTPDRDIVMNEKEMKQQTQLTTDTGKKPELTLEKKDVPVQKKDTDQPVDMAKPVTKPVQKKNEYQSSALPEESKTLTEEQKKEWVKKEQERLKVIYPNKKTIEEIDKPGKHITRVIMHVDSTVAVYLKVKHSWGGLFFFIDNPGDELRSISEQYFNLMTNLEKYGN